jgi:hypothetical protein
MRLVSQGQGHRRRRISRRRSSRPSSPNRLASGLDRCDLQNSSDEGRHECNEHRRPQRSRRHGNTSSLERIVRAGHCQDYAAPFASCFAPLHPPGRDVQRERKRESRPLSRISEALGSFPGITSGPGKSPLIRGHDVGVFGCHWAPHLRVSISKYRIEDLQAVGGLFTQ